MVVPAWKMSTVQGKDFDSVSVCGIIEWYPMGGDDCDLWVYSNQFHLLSYAIRLNCIKPDRLAYL